MMKINLSERTWNFIYVLSLGIVISTGIVCVQIYYNEMHRECLKDPLAYSSTLYEERFGYEFVGSGYLLVDKGKSPTFSFSKEGTNIQYPEDGINSIILAKPLE